jgi:hypothetical protein
MAVIINELEVVLEPAADVPQPGGTKPVPQKPLGPQDLQAMLDSEMRDRLRSMAH